MSSLIPSVSILGSKYESPGDGGGVCSWPPRRLFDREARRSLGEVAEAAGEDADEEGVLSSCDRLTLLDGGGKASVDGVDLEGER